METKTPSPAPVTISHDELMSFPILRYTGPVLLIRTAADLQHFREVIRHEHVVGFDIETRPTFRKGQTHTPSVVQIGASREVFIFQLAKLDCVHTLTEVFHNARLIKAGIALSRDLLDLQKLFPIQPAGFVDLGDVASKNGLKQTGVRNLAGMFLHGRITKGAQTSNWAAPELHQKQITYAATDAWVCRELYVHFEKLGWLKS